MATAQAVLQWMREVCLAYPSTTEADHFGEPCFRVGKRIFASCGEKDGVCRLVFQLEPDHTRQCVAADPRFQPYPRQKNCVWIDAASVTNLEDLRPLILESYRLNAPPDKPPKKGSRPARKKRPKTRE